MGPAGRSKCNLMSDLSADVELAAAVESGGDAAFAGYGEALSESTAAQNVGKIIPARTHIDESPARVLLLCRFEYLSFFGPDYSPRILQDGTGKSDLITQAQKIYLESDRASVRVIVLPRTMICRW
jgi:hypothetical protein